MADPLLTASCSLFGVSVVYILYSLIRPRFKYRVNCWFCNCNTWVAGKNRNSFRCPTCEQYNGFTPDGGYNRPMRSQEYGAKRETMRYCRSNGPDVFAMARGFVNGLCEKCNLNQNLIIESLNKFEPLREDTYWEEYEDYKFRLNQKYPLCDRCQSFSSKKILDDQSKYTPKAASMRSVFSKKASPAPSLPKGFVPLKQLTSSRRHTAASHARRKRLSSGTVTDLAHLFVLVASALLSLAHFQHLQADADTKLPVLEEYLPLMFFSLLPAVVSYGAWIALASLAVHGMGLKYSKTRYTLGDLMLFAAFPALLALHMLPANNSDILLSRLPVSGFAFVMSSAVTFLPKKLKHRKKPNTIYSAFSVASTPMSQCSSALSSRHHSMHMADESMEVDYPAQSPQNPSFRISQDRSRRSPTRDPTPSRELGNTLTGLRLDDMDESDGGGMFGLRSSMLSPGAVSPSPTRNGRGPFSSLTFNPGVRKRTSLGAQSCGVPSFTGSHSMFGSASAFNAGSVASARSSRGSAFPLGTDISQMPNPFAGRTRVVHSYGAPSTISATTHYETGGGLLSAKFYVAVAVAFAVGAIAAALLKDLIPLYFSSSK